MGYRWNQPAYSLSYANRRRLEIARATATNPKILLLDEPAAGMNPVETHEITELIAKLRSEGGYTILVIEHDMHVVEGISDRVVALDHGDEDRGGHVRRGGDERAGDRGLPRTRNGGHEVSVTGAPPLLELDAVDTYYGQIHILQGLSIRIELRRARVPARRQRVREVDDAEDDPRHRPAAQRDRLDRRRGRDEAADELPDRPRARDRAREPPALRADDRAREPRDGRVPARRAAPGRTSTASTTCSRCSTSGARSWPGRSPAASSRWSRWAVRSCRGRSCC